MPTYEYECKSCGHGFEVFQAMSDAPVKDCPECGREVRRLIFGGTGVIFKGSGFYVTDKSGSGKKEKTSPAPKSEACASCSESAKCEAATVDKSGSGEKTAGESKSA
jgi:putative FmdB family regulatory protein